MDGIPFPFIGYPMERITTVINIVDYARAKLDGIRCYASQVSPEMPFMQEDFDPAANSWFWQETFILAQKNGASPIAPGQDKENDLFAGVR
jgi:LmbE family N-acetylglucosaminyl deacetylase